MKTPALLAAILLASSTVLPNCALAGSATWNLNPINNDWNTAANWDPEVVPTEVATFAASNVTDLAVAARTLIGTITFAAGAGPFTIRTMAGAIPNAHGFAIDGAGVTNDSGIVQTLVSGTDVNNDGLPIVFTQSATVGALITVINEGNPSGSYEWGAATTFNDQSSAGDGTFYSRGSPVAISFGGTIYFSDESTAGRATLVSEGASVSGGGGGNIAFEGTASADHAVITCNGGAVSGAGGAYLSFANGSSTGIATLIAHGGVDGASGGQILFNGYLGNDQNRGRVQLYGNGQMSIGGARVSKVQIGSVEGDGLLFLYDRELVVGSNNLSTTFSGVIQGNDGYRGLSKIGTGTLTLTNSNTYVGFTFVNEGALVLVNTGGSGTGSGPIYVDGGALGGSGSVDGDVTIGSGTGTAAYLQPAVGSRNTVTFTIKGSLVFVGDGVYSCKVNTRQGTADSVIANGVTIYHGADFSVGMVRREALAPGTVFTVINNTAGTPIVGEFRNLPDGSTFTSGRNKYQVSYEGGDGNDLTLTVTK